jgi:hypothetical protein
MTPFLSESFTDNNDGSALSSFVGEVREVVPVMAETCEELV